jgi:hypothetical protein
MTRGIFYIRKNAPVLVSGGTMRVRVSGYNQGQRCPYCHKDDLCGSPVVCCSFCNAVSHAECIQANGGCPATGCGKPISEDVPAKPAASLSKPRRVWSEPKTSDVNDDSDVPATKEKAAVEFTCVLLFLAAVNSSRELFIAGLAPIAFLLYVGLRCAIAHIISILVAHWKES